MRVIMYSFETHLTKEQSNYLIIISWRVQRSTCASADSPNITFDILTRFYSYSFYRSSYFKNLNVCYANNNKKNIKTANLLTEPMLRLTRQLMIMRK